MILTADELWTSTESTPAVELSKYQAAAPATIAPAPTMATVRRVLLLFCLLSDMAKRYMSGVNQELHGRPRAIYQI
jgi:hypothetical protein